VGYLGVSSNNEWQKTAQNQHFSNVHLTVTGSNEWQKHVGKQHVMAKAVIQKAALLLFPPTESRYFSWKPVSA
jgi:hypothetical protein